MIASAGDELPKARRCGLIRLICEEPLSPPPGQDGRPLVVDVAPEQVAVEVARLRAEGWQLISEWPL